MKITALIPARAGSKRVPLKNIKPLAGKPLLFWSIDAAIQAACFHKIVVSSEAREVLDLVRGVYSERQVETILRPESLATDQADLMDVCRHFLVRNEETEYLCLMMPTYPFRDPGIIQNAILPALYSRQIDRVVSVAPQSYSTFDYWIKKEREFRRMFAHAPLWCTAGNAAYSVMRRDYYFTEPQKWPAQPGERVLRIQTDAREALDIDTDEDFEMAERLVKGESFKKRRILFHRSDTHEYALPEGVEPDEFKAFLSSRGVNLGSPILILTSPTSLFHLFTAPRKQQRQELLYGRNHGNNCFLAESRSFAGFSSPLYSFSILQDTEE